MRTRSRLDALERRVSPTGECGCNGSAWGEMLLCRDPSVPPPPPKLCERCQRPMSRLILGPVPWAKCEGPYEPADTNTIRRLMAPPGAAYEPADFGTIERMMCPSLGPP